jgi:phage-related protein
MGKFNPDEIVFERPKTKFNPDEIVMDKEFSKDNNGSLKFNPDEIITNKKLAPLWDRLGYGWNAMFVDDVDIPNRSDIEGANVIADASDREGVTNIGEDFVYVRGNPIPITRTKEQQELRDKLARQKDDVPNLSSLIVGHEQEDGSFSKDPKTAFEKRIKIINDKEKLKLKEEYKHLTKADKESAGAFVGTMGKIFWTPTTLIGGPLWKSKSIANAITKFGAVGGLWGGSYSAIDQTASKGEIDKKKLATDTALGVGLGGAIRGGGEIVIKTGQKVIPPIIKAITPTYRKIKNANKIIEDVKLETAIASVNNVPEKNIRSTVFTKLGLKDEIFEEAMALTDTTPNLPNKYSIKEAMKIIENHASKNPTKKGGLYMQTVVGVHSRMKDISDYFAARLRKFEFNISDKIGFNMKKVQPFIKQIETGFFNIGGGFNKISKGEKRLISRALFNGKFDEVKKILGKYKIKSKAFDDVSEVLDDLYTQAVNAGLKIGKLKNYFPRIAKDVTKLKAMIRNIDLDEANLLDHEIRNATTKSGKSLNDYQVTEILSKRLNAAVNMKVTNTTNFTKQRKIKEVYEEILDLYKSPEAALQDYITRMVTTIEKQKFFGKAIKHSDLDVNDVGKHLDDKSFSDLLKAELPHLSQNQLDEMLDLLKARFNMGEQKVGSKTSVYKNIVYSTHLGNPYNALTQLGDIGVSAYLEGFFNIINAIFRKKNIDVKDFGIENWGVELGTNTGFFRSVANASFKLGLFKGIDRFGKNNLINAAYYRVAKQIKSKKGLAKLRKEYEPTFGKDFDNFVAAVKKGDFEDYNVKLYLFNRLSDAQPISLSEMPTGYLNNPRARWMYTLKSFTMKQLDILRRDVWKQFGKSGVKNKAIAAKNLAMYTLLVTGGNTSIQQVKNLVLGRGDDITKETVSDDFVNNILKQVFLSKYALGKIEKGNRIADVLIDSAAPPWDFINAIGADFMEFAKVVGLKDRTDDEVWSEKTHKYKSTKHLPITGRLGYEHLFGGREEYERKKENEAWKE